MTDSIENHRQRYLAKALRPWERLIDKYFKAAEDRPVCKEAYPGLTKERRAKREKCDTFMIGSIVRSGIAKGLYPLPSAPYRGLSLQRTMTRLQRLPFIAECDDPSIEWPRGKKPVRRGHGHSRGINKYIAGLQREISLISLKDVVGPTAELNQG